MLQYDNKQPTGIGKQYRSEKDTERSLEKKSKLTRRTAPLGSAHALRSLHSIWDENFARSLARLSVCVTVTKLFRIDLVRLFVCLEGLRATDLCEMCE